MTDRSAWCCRLVTASLLASACAFAACSQEDPGSNAAVAARPSTGDDTATETETETRPVAKTPPVASLVSPPGAVKGGGEQAPQKSPPPAPVPDLYDPDIIPKFALTFDPAAMAILSSTAVADQTTWVHGSFTYGDITFTDVGVRRKGSESFRVLPQKAALKVKLNKWVKGQKLHGLEELTLNNMTSDPTALHERLSYHVFRSLGLPAVRANAAELTINGASYGLYANLETPDENFVARVFGTKAGSLYEVTSQGSSWLPTASRFFEIDVPYPGAAPGAKPDVGPLLSAVAAANDATLLADLDARLRTSQWLRFAAAEAVTGQVDGYAYGVIGYSHNYSLAGDTDGKFSITPWSLDLTLANFGGVVPDAAHPPNDTVFARCRRSATCWSAYESEMRSVLALFETLDIVSLAKKWHAQIDDLVRADPKRETSLGRYDDETSKMYLWLAARPNIIRAQLGL